MARTARKVRNVSFTNVGKVFFPTGSFTKGDLIRYYVAVAPVLLPHLKDRPVTLIRMPEGVRGEKFYEKNCPAYAPGWIRTTLVPKSEGGEIRYILINDVETLAWCANNAAVELHPFLHRAANIQHPTHLAFDLDPGEGTDILTCIDVAETVRDTLATLHLEAFPKVTGSKGIQLYVPLNTPVNYDVAAPFAKAVAELLQQRHPDLVVSEMSKALRVGKIFIDWSQNNEKKTTAGVYSVRGKRDEPFVSLPVTWQELSRAKKRGNPQALFFTPKEALKRIAKTGDLFAPVLALKQRLPPAFVQAAPKIARRKPSSALRPYAEKRDFSKTAEPGPNVPTRSRQGSRRRFVIQKHAASHLHYDFRLEMDEVLKSWAVPKGLSTEAGVKRSAFQTEDHPLEYFSFEGTIPAGQYGGGTVMVWDIGTYEVLGGNYWKGDLKLHLSGKKISGEWHLFRIRSEESKPVWLIQKAGESARPVSKKADDLSVLSRRTMAQISKSTDSVWESDRKGAESDPVPPAPRRKKAKKTGVLPPSPTFVEPMLAQAVSDLPAPDEWMYELKLDGYRGLGIKHGNKIQLLSRNQNDLGGNFPDVVAALSTLSVESVLLDGEIVALNESGKPSFQLLQNRGKDGHPTIYFAFDILSLNGEDLRERPLRERREKLEQVVAGSGIRLSPKIDGDPDTVIAAVKKMRIEGVIAKRRDSTYQSGERNGHWVKLKLSPEQEFVIGGYKRGAPLESLVVGCYDEGKLLCAGKVRQGLDPRLRRKLANLFRPLRTEHCPFDNLPHSKKSRWGEGITKEEMENIQWLRPEVVGQVSFTEWTSGGNLRHAAFKGLREDKSAKDVVRERS
jgi:bifunctional non-homologous end joining protein LigD